MNDKSKKTNRSEESQRSATQLSLPIKEKEEAKDMTVDTGKDFEEALVELEKIVTQLEGEVKLEEALQLFDKGMQLSKSCEGILKTAEQKIEILKRAADGSLTAEKFNEESIQGN